MIDGVKEAEYVALKIISRPGVIASNFTNEGLETI